METIAVLAWAALVAIRVLPEIIRSRRTCVSVVLTTRAEGVRELAITATNVEDAVQVVRQALTARPEDRRRTCHTGTGLLSRRACGYAYPPTDPGPPCDDGRS
ncbi:hypothetical protein [Nocardia concava]|uniref:hypothetical protein n=1 Tax=Nocardia concava TaxID=257281 RepID=UPI00030A2401|nr:hypothetical protein [Nocardia concava]